jgi:hypothetical protein
MRKYLFIMAQDGNPWGELHRVVRLKAYFGLAEHTKATWADLPLKIK